MVHSEGHNTFIAVLQKQGDRLTLVGLAPHGGRGFLLEQIGQEVRFEKFIPVQLRFPPRFILHDIHRTWFPAADPDEDVRVERENGRILERGYTRRSGQPSGEITIKYEGGLADGAPLRAEPPSVVTFDNGWFGYRGAVRTLSWQPL